MQQWCHQLYASTCEGRKSRVIFKSEGTFCTAATNSCPPSSPHPPHLSHLPEASKAHSFPPFLFSLTFAFACLLDKHLLSSRLWGGARDTKIKSCSSPPILGGFKEFNSDILHRHKRKVGVPQEGK